ncbi:MAG: cache domain-containing protein, partial [Kiritimatiellae bacterium]|nr:cache domain-containing protein [Kiritimatiellia bacterium]
MKKKISYIKFVKMWGLILLLSLGISIISIDVIRTYQEFNIRAEKMRTDYIEQQKQVIRREAGNLLEDITRSRRRQIRLYKAEVKTRVLEVYSIAQNIYHEHKGGKTDAEIKKLIADAVLDIISEDENVTYFMVTLDGTELVPVYNPDVDGANVLEYQDVAGKYVIKDMISIVKESGDGFYESQGGKPGESKSDFKKISSVKLFEPYGWMIGADFYLYDIEEYLKELFIEQVNDTHYGQNGYFFSHNWQGITLAHGSQPELAGADMWEAQGGHGIKLVQKLITVSQSKTGGYVKYWWRKPDTQEDRPKITFAVGIRDWQCYLATGVYLDDIDPVIADQQALLVEHIKEKLILFITFVTITIILFLIFFNRVNAKLEKDLSQFITFFKSAAKANKEIDNRFIRFAEFDQMANSANEMLRDKIYAEKMLEDEKEQLAVTLRSIGDGVITTDTEGRVELMNTVAEELTGWRNKDAKGKMLAEVFRIIDEETRGIVDNPVSQVLELGSTVDIKQHTVLVSKSGAECDIADSAAPIRGSDSSIHGVVLVFRDVTEQKKAENLLFNAKKLESIGILAGGIAHDF